jgi:TolB-like protein/DNA-binding SARP family transcriptional activator
MIAPGGDDILPRLRKSRALLAYLCLAEGTRVSRSRLIGLLWDRSADTQARFSLRHALSEINRDINSRLPNLVEIDREWVRLNSKACWIDALTIADHPDRLLDDLEGVSVPFDHWLAAERAQIEDRLRTRLEQDFNNLTEEGASAQLRAGAARKLGNIEPTNELAVRGLMTAFAEIGDRPQAIREYERCRRALRTMLDLAPSRETTALYEAIRIATSSRIATALDQPPVFDRRDISLAYEAPATEKKAVAAPIGRGSQPSIAVLPFSNLSGEPAHNIAADGVVEDLIEILSRVPNFFVISRLSTQSFRNHDRLPKEIGELLGVRYVLSGSVRIVADRVRLSVELTDGESGAALWNSRFDEKLGDLLDVQHDLADAVVRRVAPFMHSAELKRIRIKHPENLGAYDLFLRAQESMHNSARAVFDASERLFEEAIAREPGYAAALAWRAWWHLLRVGQGWSPDPEQDAEQARQFAHRAIERDRLEPMAYAVRGHIASYLYRDFSLAFECFETALNINPNAAPVWLWSAAARAYNGEGRRAIEEINRAMALSPYDPLMYAYSSIASLAYLTDGQCERAIECALRSTRENRTFTTAYKLLIMALGVAGRETEAQTAVQQLLELEPQFTVDQFRQRSPTMASPLGEIYCGAFARAGIPLAG